MSDATAGAKTSVSAAQAPVRRSTPAAGTDRGPAPVRGGSMPTSADPSSASSATPGRGRSGSGTDPDIAVYVISVAAELAGMHPQTLRQYDRLGLVSPGRSAGRGRRYSARDIAVLREVQRLSHEEGVNLAGIKRVLELEAEVDALRDQVLELARELDRAREDAVRSSADVAMSYQRRYLPVPVTTTSGALVIWSSGSRES